MNNFDVFDKYPIEKDLEYLTDNTKKYDNKVTDIVNTLSDMINNVILFDSLEYYVDSI